LTLFASCSSALTESWQQESTRAVAIFLSMDDELTGDQVFFREKQKERKKEKRTSDRSLMMTQWGGVKVKG